MSMYPKPIIHGMKFHPGTEYMICIRTPENGGGQVAVKQKALVEDKDWVPWQPEEFRDKPSAETGKKMTPEEVIALVAETFGEEAAEALKPKKEAVAPPPSKKELPEKQNTATMSKVAIAAILNGIGLDADANMTKKQLVSMYEQLYDE